MATLLCLGCTTAQAEWQLSPSLNLELNAYGDSADGTLDANLEEALGVYNVHTHGADEEESSHSHGFEEGVRPGHSEFSLDLSHDSGFSGRMSSVFAPDHLNLEELWLGYGKTWSGLYRGEARLGRFLSAFAAESAQHAHAMPFASTPLGYRMLLGSELYAHGVQLSLRGVLSHQTTFTLGAEAFNAENEAVGGYVGSVNGYLSSKGKVVNIPMAAQEDSPRQWALYGELEHAFSGRDLASVGAGYLWSRQHQELHQFHPGINDADHGLDGDLSTWQVNARYRRQFAEHRALTLFAEYLYQRKDLSLAFHEDKPFLTGQPRDLRLDALRVSALYDLNRRWGLGLRYEQVGNTHEARRDGSAPTCPNGVPCPRQTSRFDDIPRWTAMLRYRPAPGHELRLEYAELDYNIGEDLNQDGRDDVSPRSGQTWLLQYRLAFGHAHGHDHVH